MCCCGGLRRPYDWHGRLVSEPDVEARPEAPHINRYVRALEDERAVLAQRIQRLERELEELRRHRSADPAWA